MKLKIANNSGRTIAKLGIGGVVCLLLGVGVLLYAQDKAKVEFVATKPVITPAKKGETDWSKAQAMMKMKAQADAKANRSRGRQRRGGIDFGENEEFYRVIIDNNLFRPLGWTPPKNEPAYSLIGTTVGTDDTLSQATLLERRSNRYHFVTIGAKLGDMTVKDIQAKQVTLDKAGKPITLKAGNLQFLQTSRGRESSRGRQSNEGQSEKAGDESAKNQANAKREAEKRRQMERQKRAAGFGGELAEKLKGASPEERQEIMREIRRRAGSRRGRGDRGRRD